MSPINLKPAAGSGRQLAYAQRTTGLASQTNTSYADTGLTLTDFTIGSRPVMFRLHIPYPQVTAAATPAFALTTSANVVIAEWTSYHGVAFGSVPMTYEYRLTAAGIYTGYKIRHKVNSGQSFSIVLPTIAGVAAFAEVVER